MMSEEPNTNARETYAPPHKVLTNDDLLTEIFIRLPILCIHLFTCVSKQWLKIYKSAAFTLKRSHIRCLDSPAGLFVNHIRSLFDCDFVSLDPRINSKKYTIKNAFTLGSTEEADKVKILQSCNCLLLCTGSRRHAFDYVYNPSINLLKILPKPDYANVDSNVYGCAGLRERQLEPFAMYDMRPKQVDHKVYEFIPSYASVWLSFLVEFLFEFIVKMVH
nr:hypothetical protein [Tanacetum cinerariifolium]